MVELEAIRGYLQGCPALQDIPFQVDYLSKRPGLGGIFPEGAKVLSRRQDILGGEELRLREQYRIRLRLPHMAEGDNSQNAARLAALQRWALDAELPRFGERQSAAIEKGRLVGAMGQGLGAYEAVLTVEYTVRVGA